MQRFEDSTVIADCANGVLFYVAAPSSDGFAAACKDGVAIALRLLKRGLAKKLNSGLDDAKCVWVVCATFALRYIATSDAGRAAIVEADDCDTINQAYKVSALGNEQEYRILGQLRRALVASAKSR